MISSFPAAVARKHQPLEAALPSLGPKLPGTHKEKAPFSSMAVPGEKNREICGFRYQIRKNGNDRFVIINYRIKYTYRTEKGDIICIYSLHVIFRIYIYMIYIYDIYIYEIHTYLYYIYISIKYIVLILYLGGLKSLTISSGSALPNPHFRRSTGLFVTEKKTTHP